MKAIFFISICITGSVLGTVVFETRIPVEPPLLRDGFVLSGIDGKLVDVNDTWFFELGSDVNDYRAVAKAGTKLELLPSSALEKMVDELRANPALKFQLWGAQVTKYKGRNFIFPGYFLPLSRPVEPLKKADGQIKDNNEPNEPAPELQVSPESELDDANNVLNIPPEILKQLRARRQKISDSGQRVARAQPQGDEERKTENAPRPAAQSVVVDRTGFMVRQDGRFVFMADGLGRNAGSAVGTLRLLPNEILEHTELKRADQLERMRLKIAGITTEYKGAKYLLLQKATEVYSHGNFGK